MAAVHDGDSLFADRCIHFFWKKLQKTGSFFAPFSGRDCTNANDFQT